MSDVFFLTYSRTDAAVCHAFYRLLQAVFPDATVHVDLDPDGIPGQTGGSPWPESLEDNLFEATIAVQLLSPAAQISSYVLYEAGIQSALRRGGRLRVAPVCIEMRGGELEEPFRSPQAWRFDAATLTEERVVDWLNDLVSERRRFALLKRLTREEPGRTAVKAFVKDYKAAVAKTNGSTPALAAGAIANLRRLDPTVGHALFQQVTGWWLTEFSKQVADVRKNGRVTPAAAEYPRYLLKLLADNEVHVDAVAMVDGIEQFWTRAPGEEILGASLRRGGREPRARRIFVFDRAEVLVDHLPTLRRHTDLYHVRVLSRDLFGKRSRFVSDFSLFRSGNNKEIVAFYQDLTATHKICFSTAEDDITPRRAAFDAVWDLAVPPAPIAEKDLLQRLFAPRRTRREHSLYMDLKKYHECELEHPFFAEMMDEMIRQFRSRVRLLPDSPPKVLEMGAGTGHFTLRLIRSGMELGRIAAIEVDEPSVDLMFGNAEISEAHVELYARDARMHDPPGKFDAVFSSFSDHHIMADDDTARQYLENVKLNLHAGSLFIVGDEFLGPHDGSIEDRKKAVVAYHSFIIDTAKRRRSQCNDPEEVERIDGLIELEEAAMKSGVAVLDDPNTAVGGDFKVPLATYLARIRRAGLSIEATVLVGDQDPAQAEQVGGIWVVVAKLSDDGQNADLES